VSLVNFAGPVYSMEASPNHRLYFSTPWVSIDWRTRERPPRAERTFDAMRTIRTTVRLLILTLIASSLAAVTLAPAANAGASIKVLKVKGGLRGPAGFTFLPGGKLLYAERGTGRSAS
jgi:hypothetical protein